VPFVALALSANRSVPPAWIALSPIIGRFHLPLRTSLKGAPVAVGLSVVFLVVPLFVRPDDPIDRSRFPVEAARRLTAERVFHSDASGGWLIYTQWPQRMVYIDDRA